MKVVFDTEGLKSDAGTNRRDTKKICGLEVLYLNIYLEIYMIFFCLVIRLLFLKLNLSLFQRLCISSGSFSIKAPTEFSVMVILVFIGVYV